MLSKNTLPSHKIPISANIIVLQNKRLQFQHVTILTMEWFPLIVDKLIVTLQLYPKPCRSTPILHISTVQDTVSVYDRIIAYTLTEPKLVISVCILVKRKFWKNKTLLFQSGFRATLVWVFYFCYQLSSILEY